MLERSTPRRKLAAGIGSGLRRNDAAWGSTSDLRSLATIFVSTDCSSTPSPTSPIPALFVVFAEIQSVQVLHALV
jgi:hypothetical protein